MKKGILLFLSGLSCVGSWAQSNQFYEIKAEYIQGNILKHTEHIANLIKGPVTGGEVALEWQTMGKKPWSQYLGFPKVGLGAVYLSLSNPDTLGNVWAVYPYLKFPIVKTRAISIYIKPGAGVSYVTKTFHDAIAYDASGNIVFDRSNAAIGSHLNVYFAGSLNVDIPLKYGLSLTGDAGWNHVSNGSFYQPNSGINMLNCGVGLKYMPDYKDFKRPKRRDIGNIPRRWAVDMVLSGGTRQLYFKDNKFFPIGSVTLAAFYPLTNFYRTGIGFDAFYDGVYGEVNSAARASGNTTAYKFTYITSNVLANKIRVGISWQHEVIIGKLAAGIHAGLYLYNPVRNLEPYATAKSSILDKGFIYPYDIEKENGWLYTRASLKYLLAKNLFLSLGLKTHLYKAEFIEWGLGCRL
ncbi:MAG TPA: acyloxyacyl hydrolase [Paludibacter sp.]|nr:acyloxyacyl hydrolase [Paludibacter sp.]